MYTPELFEEVRNSKTLKLVGCAMNTYQAAPKNSFINRGTWDALCYRVKFNLNGSLVVENDIKCEDINQKDTSPLGNSDFQRRNFERLYLSLKT